MKEFRTKLAAMAVAISTMAVSAVASAELPASVQTEITALVGDITTISGYVMTAVITVAGAFALIKWVRRGISRV